MVAGSWRSPARGSIAAPGDSPVERESIRHLPGKYGFITDGSKIQELGDALYPKC